MHLANELGKVVGGCPQYSSQALAIYLDDLEKEREKQLQPTAADSVALHLSTRDSGSERLLGPLDCHSTHQRRAAKCGIQRLLFEAEPWKDFWARSPAAATNWLCDLGKGSPPPLSLNFHILRGTPFCTSTEEGSSALHSSSAL